MSVYRSAAVALNIIMSGKVIDNVSMAGYSASLQKLYIKYVKMMPFTSTDEYVLGPRAFFIYLIKLPRSGVSSEGSQLPRSGIASEGNQKPKHYTSDSLEGCIKDMVRSASNMDTTPSEIAGGKHLVALKIFASL